MKENYRILYEGGEGEIVEKKSRFIATIRPVESEDEAVSFIAEMKKKYWDATHNCSAFTVGENFEISRCSDDGEPAQTAGRPMLDVLLGEEIHNVCAVVTRYFGGTLLGTGGLVRAYSGAVQEGLKNCVILEKKLAEKLELKTDYSDLGKIQYILAEQGITVLGSEYSDKVVLTALAPLSEAQVLKKKLTEGTGGRCLIELLDKVYFGVTGGETVIF
ncbi:YigZ family protein [[Clostridium] symbiosum]|uniref:YigZ family protein n=1 Tax=Clostridium symbiosum TaxID=1512 RepID=UPI001D085CAA|nr:YigZ family protein [[Clostridium] symbiosum]MCB6611352.1 YigZ family protein [[Clostridium] symbiosum]MCB6929393.1 YigZ family protein [[Clostridium] symbiosum]